MTNYEIETIDNAGELIARILSDDESILENSAAMDAVGAAVVEQWGENAKTVGRGSSYFDSQGREAGWEWTVEMAGEHIRFDESGTTNMVWCDGEPVRCASQADMDTLPVGAEMTAEEVSSLES